MRFTKRSRGPAIFLLLMLQGLLGLVSACADSGEEVASDTPTPPPTPTPGPYINQTTWFTQLYDPADDEDVVVSDTDLFINIDRQTGTELLGLIYHLHGTLNIDGYDVPTGVGWTVHGVYGPDAKVVLDADFYGHLFHLDGEIAYEGLALQGTATLDEDQYSSFLILANRPYNEPVEPPEE